MRPNRIPTLLLGLAVALAPAVGAQEVQPAQAPASEPSETSAEPAPAPAAPAQETPQVYLALPEDFARDLEEVPCRREERMEGVKDVFRSLGAKDSEFEEQPFDGGTNVVLVRPGATEELIVLGAHYDKTGQGCGAVDNWTGIVTLAHLWRTMGDLFLQKTVVFVAFDREEDGLIGSDTMVRAIPDEDLPRYCAMINMDSFGMSHPQVALNMSDTRLANTTQKLARKFDIKFTKGSIRGGRSDSNSFLARRIPAVTLTALSNRWRNVLHTANDQVDKIQPNSVYLGYRLALVLALEIDGAACDAWR